MDKERYAFLLQNFSSLSEEETHELEGVQKQFPYCQVTHVLTTRGAQNHQSQAYQKLLHQAAVYSTDRAVLKSILSAPTTSRDGESLSEEPPLVATATSTDGNLHGDELINEVMADLDRLKELKHNFEVTLQEYDKAVHTPAGAKKKLVESPISVPPPTPPKPEVTVEQAPVIPPDEEPLGDALLEEIRTKKKLKSEGSKQKEQIEIINQFIKKQPSITKNSLPSVDSPDLAEKSISLTDNIVSETLVEILLRQGKKDKAIEVLKKLIWKFPQKKSIFAAQIEELRKQ